MGSPESSKLAPTTPTSKDSPFFNFANNLTPIKEISNMYSNQAFENTDVPSPWPVFTTPQHCLRNLKLCKRSQFLPFPRKQKNYPGNAHHESSCLEYASMTRQFVSMSAQSSCFSERKSSSDCIEKFFSDGTTQDQLCSSPSCVDAFLSIPSDEYDNSSCSPGLLPSQAADMAQDKEIIYMTINEDQMTGPNEESVQVPLPKSALMINKSLCVRTNHLGLSDEFNIQLNQDVVAPKELPKNSIICEGAKVEAYISNSGVSSNPSSSICGKNDPSRLNPSCSKAPNALEETEIKRKIPGRKLGLAINNVRTSIDLCIPSVSSSRQEHIPLHSKESDHSRVPDSMVGGIVVHGDECPNTSSSKMIEVQDVNIYSAATGCDQLDCTTRLQSQSNSITQFNALHLEILNQMADAAIGNQIRHVQEDVMHTYWGMCECLMFEDYEKQVLSIRHNKKSMNTNCPSTISVIPAASLNMANLHASSRLFITTSDIMQPIPSLADNISCSYLVGADSCRQSKERYPAMVLRPSGIGLHLNSIGHSAQTCSHSNMLMPTKDLGSRGMPFFKDSCEVSSLDLKHMMPSVRSNYGDSSFCSVDQCINKRCQKPPDTVVGCHSSFEEEPLSKCVQSNLSDYHVIPCNRKRLPYEESSISEDSAQTSPRKKSCKKKALENEGQKPCHCKRSKCLKLYCDCFASGNICNEACACMDCSNKLENEEAVHSSREQILLRNPLAFVSKVVHANDTSESRDIRHITPPSTRHKRGCNCKRSKCQKKYCECFQAGVTCSFGCRCEGCNNVYGTKDAYGNFSQMVMEHKMPKEHDHNDRVSSGEMVDDMEADSEASSANHFNSNFIPTPDGNDVYGSQFSASRHPSHDFDEAALPSHEPSTSKNDPACQNAYAEKGERPLSVIPYNQRIGYCSLSHEWNGFSGISNLSPLSNLSSKFYGSSTSIRTEKAKISRPKPYKDRDILSCDSIHRNRSPATPLHRFGEGKFEIESSNSELLNFEVETPEFWKVTGSPIKSVKVSSPNKKRVSPPQKWLRDAGSTLTPSLNEEWPQICIAIDSTISTAYAIQK